MPEKLIMSYEHSETHKINGASNSEETKPKVNKTTKMPARLSLLRKQIVRTRIFQGLRIMQLKAKLKR